MEPFQNVCHYFLFDTAHSAEKEIQSHLSPIQEIKDKSASPQSGPGAAGGPSHREGSGMGFPAYGGTGKQFNWTILENAKINKPFFLSGGIGPEDVEKIKAFQHPYLYAIDINSRFETEPGIKNMVAVKVFMSDLNVQASVARDDDSSNQFSTK